MHQLCAGFMRIFRMREVESGPCWGFCLQGQYKLCGEQQGAGLERPENGR